MEQFTITLQQIFFCAILWKLFCFYSFHMAKGFKRRILVYFIKLTRKVFKQFFKSFMRLIDKGTVFSRKQNHKSSTKLPNNVIPFPKPKHS